MYLSRSAVLDCSLLRGLQACGASRLINYISLHRQPILSLQEDVLLTTALDLLSMILTADEVAQSCGRFGYDWKGEDVSAATRKPTSQLHQEPAQGHLSGRSNNRAPSPDKGKQRRKYEYVRGAQTVQKSLDINAILMLQRRFFAAPKEAKGS